MLTQNALLNTIDTHFSSLQDPRMITKNTRHNFIDILFIAICGAICGANYWTGIAAYGRAKEEWLKTFLELPGGIPSHDTFNDVFIKLDADQFEKCFSSWVSSISELINDDVISIDGKTLRRSHDHTDSKKPIHMVSAWSTSNALVLGQLTTSEKSNEITAIPELLDRLVIEKCLVTIDAMGCQKKIAEKIIERKSDYFFAVKDNQPNLHSAIKKLFHESDDEEFNLNFSKCSKVSNKGHGREETRRCWVCTDLTKLECDISGWKQIQAIIVVESERKVKGESTTIEQRFYISSTKKSAKYFLNASRSHWHIENKLHWSLDVSFREDESRLRKGDGAENFAIIRRIALNLLRNEDTEKTGIETKRLRAGWDNKYLKTVLSGLTI